MHDADHLVIKIVMIFFSSVLCDSKTCNGLRSVRNTFIFCLKCYKNLWESGSVKRVKKLLGHGQVGQWCVLYESKSFMKELFSWMNVVHKWMNNKVIEWVEEYNGAAFWKKELWITQFQCLCDQQTNRQMDTTTYKDTRTHLKWFKLSRRFKDVGLVSGPIHHHSVRLLHIRLFTAGLISTGLSDSDFLHSK